MYVDDYHVTFTKNHEDGLVYLLQLLNISVAKEYNVNPLFSIGRIIDNMKPSMCAFGFGDFQTHDFGMRGITIDSYSGKAKG